MSILALFTSFGNESTEPESTGVENVSVLGVASDVGAKLWVSYDELGEQLS